MLDEDCEVEETIVGRIKSKILKTSQGESPAITEGWLKCLQLYFVSASIEADLEKKRLAYANAKKTLERVK